MNCFILSACGSKKDTLSKDDKYRTFYEVFVYSFSDSDGDGIGDINGLINRLDYLNDGDDKSEADLGISGIWLMPIMPSTTYHKYDVVDYCAIDEEYGDMEDFDKLISECDKRNINLIIDLVMNHTSSKHPWFLAASEYLLSLDADEEADVNECPYVSYYNFSKGMKWGYYQLGDSDWYYEGGFWSEMPDLNLENELVRVEFEKIAKFWLDKGVSGFRLDAVKEFVKDDTERNVEILSWFNSYVKGVNPDAYIVGEAWTSQPEYAKYYASGIDSLFDFAFAGNEGYVCKFANKTYNARDLGDYLERENARFYEQNELYVNAPFYSNHDMDRAAEYYDGDNRLSQTKMALALNLTMSGNAFLYYGDELGMLGSGKDENKRLAMRWGLEASDLCKGPMEADQIIEQIYEPLDRQILDSNSIYNWTKSVIKIRNRHEAIRKGDSVELPNLSDANVVSILKTYGEHRRLVIYNFSEEEGIIDLTKEKLADGKELTASMISDCVSADNAEYRTEGNKIYLPAFSLMVLTID